MKAYISEIMFDKMLKAVKNGVSQNENRAELKFIRVRVKESKVTAFTCDGCSATRMTFEATKSDGDFECLIKPIPFKMSKCKLNMVCLSLEDGEATLEFPTEYGTLMYRFKQKIQMKIDIDKICGSMDSHDREIGINANLMGRIMRSFSSVVSDRNKLVIMESKDKNLEGFRMRAEEDTFTLEQYLLPIRFNPKNNEKDKGQGNETKV